MKSTWAGSCQILTVMTLASAAAWADCKNPATQSDMNECAGTEYRAADAELNKVYKQLMATGDEPFRKRLQAAQRAWLAFRDAHLAATYPPEEGDISRLRLRASHVHATPAEGPHGGTHPATEGIPRADRR